MPKRTPLKTDFIGAVYVPGLERVVVLNPGHADFAAVTPLVLERVRHLVTLGEADEKLERTFTQVPTTRAATIEAAVAAARSHATPGGVVLLSPGCASYDMFRNFEDRGARFEAAVHALERERTGAGR